MGMPRLRVEKLATRIGVVPIPTDPWMTIALFARLTPEQRPLKA
jgi:hypothetical protein